MCCIAIPHSCVRTLNIKETLSRQAVVIFQLMTGNTFIIVIDPIREVNPRRATTVSFDPRHVAAGFASCIVVNIYNYIIHAFLVSHRFIW